MSTIRLVCDQAIEFILKNESRGISVADLCDKALTHTSLMHGDVPTREDMRAAIIDGCNLTKWLQFDNRKGGVFMAIDQDPSDEKFYNVWYVNLNRWTNHKSQDTTNPRRLTWEEAHDWLIQVGGGMEIREVLKDNTPGPAQATRPTAPVVAKPTAKAVASSTPVDADKKKEMAFFAKVGPGECPCGCPKARCNIHRDL